MHSQISPWSKKAGTIQVYFTSRRWRSKGLRELSWMKSLYDKLWIMFHGLSEFALGPPLGGGLDANSGIPCQNQGSSQLHGHGPWLVCEVVLKIYGHDHMIMIPYKNKASKIFLGFFSFCLGGGGVKKEFGGPTLTHAWSHCAWFQHRSHFCWKRSSGRTSSELQMNRLSLRNNRSKFETLGELPFILEESIEYTSHE